MESQSQSQPERTQINPSTQQTQTNINPNTQKKPESDTNALLGAKTGAEACHSSLLAECLDACHH
jgi:hypothetical protein